MLNSSSSHRHLVTAIKIGLALILFTPLILLQNFYFPFIVPRNLFFRLIIDIVFSLCLYLSIVDINFRPRFNKGFILFFCSVVIYLLFLNYFTKILNLLIECFFSIIYRNFLFSAICNNKCILFPIINNNITHFNCFIIRFKFTNRIYNYSIFIFILI